MKGTGKKILDTGWKTENYEIPENVVSYRILMSYTDNRTLTDSDAIKFEKCITFTTLQKKSEIFEVGSLSNAGTNMVSTNRIRSINSYKTDETGIEFDGSPLD